MTWREYSETELEREYTPASRVANIQIYLDDYATRGDHARQTISHQQINVKNVVAGFALLGVNRIACVRRWIIKNAPQVF